MKGDEMTERKAKKLLLQAFKNELSKIQNLADKSEKQIERIEELQNAILVYEMKGV